MPIRKWGQERLVNLATAGNQADPAVAALTDGGYLLAWEDLTGGSRGQVNYQRYDAIGNPVGGPGTIAGTAATPGALNPFVTGRSDGGFSVGYDDLFPSPDIKPTVVSFGAAGNFLSTRTLTGAPGAQDQITVDRNGTGLVAVWHDASANSGDIVASLLDASGNFIATPSGMTFRINATTAGSQSRMSRRWRAAASPSRGSTRRA